VALVQTGQSQDVKWDEAHRELGVEQLLSLTEQAAGQGAELVIWPETAWPYRGLRRRVTNTRKIGKLARKLKVDILVSSIEETEPGEADSEWRNSVSLVLASGRFAQHYDKRRLAPFAEHLPLPFRLQSLLRRVPPFSRISRFVPGTEPTVFQTTGGRRFAVLICYESMTPTMAAEMSEQVDFFVVVTNDAPFDHQPANEAHFRSAILRASETGKPVLQAANTGVTGVIAGGGRVLARTAKGLSGPSVQYCAP
jgi:apolipoprotein N-acyltransferase